MTRINVYQVVSRGNSPKMNEYVILAIYDSTVVVEGPQYVIRPDHSIVDLLILAG